MNHNELELQAVEAIEGEKSGGGGSSPPEAQNTLSSRSMIRVVEVISEGEIVGLAGGAKGIYFNDTPLQATDGSYNFKRADWDYRVGLPTQTYMAGFPDVQSVVAVNTQVTTSSPLIRTSSSPDIDAVRVAIGLPQGLATQNTGSGQLVGGEVEFAIDHKLTSSGSWVSVGTYKIDGKTVSSFERQYKVQRPTGTGTWDIRVRRLTANAPSSSVRNDTYVNSVTEIQDIKLAYEDTAVVGFSIDAEQFGNQIPKRAYLVKGVKVQIPSNYNPVTRVYTGIWNGTFTTAWTDNPAWVLYDMVSHARYGLGEFISASQIDKASFYDAAVYCDELVDDGEGGTQPRFTFNAVIASREQAMRLLNATAGAMRGSLIYMNGQVRLLQDRPVDPVKLITNANVLDGLFDYRSSGLFDRHTAFNITWNDRNDRHLQRVTTIDSSNIADIAPVYVTKLAEAEAAYGYNSVDISAFGATNEGQAIRHGLWALDTELYQTEIAQWKMSVNGFDLIPGDVVTVYDQDYVGQRGGGRIVSVAGTTVTLDRSVTLVPGSTLTVLLADGLTTETKAIVETSGATATFTIASGFAQAVLPYADYIVTHAASPRQFKVLSLTQEDLHTVAVEAVYHDPNKFARVEDGIVAPTPVFSTVRPSINNAVTGLQFRETQINDASEGLNGLRRALLITWVAPTQGDIRHYVVKYRNNGGEWQQAIVFGPSFEINPAFGGSYAVDIAPMSGSNILGPSVTGSYTVQTAGGGASPLSAPTNLQVIGGGSTFSGVDLNFQWTNPAGNTADIATLRDFEVRFIETVGSTTVRTVYLSAVPAGSISTAAYTFAMNVADGGPRRSIQVQVRCRDAANNLSSPATVTFSNPAPATITTTVSAAIRNNFVRLTRPTDADFRGYLLWASTTSGFTPSAGNLIYEGDGTSFTHSGLNDSETWYYRAAAYDVFAKDYAGAGLNVSSQVSATTNAGANVNEYELNGVTWTPNSPGANQVAWSACTAIQTLGSGAGSSWAVSAGNASWSSGILFIYYVAGASALSSTTTLTTALASSSHIIVATYRGGTNLEIGNGRAYMDGSFIIAGTVGATQVVSSGLITNTAQINNAVITNAKIVDLDGGKIIANTVTATQINSNGLLLRDGSGNIILGAGNALPIAYAAAGTVNSAISIAANGVLSGAGGGAVTVAGLDNTIVRSANPITAANISTYIASAAISNAYIGTAAINLANINTATIGTLSTLSTNMGNISAGQFTTGSMTGYAWPASGLSGTYLGPSGLLIGNANDGRYFQADSSGNVYAPNFSIINGVMTISQANVINTLNLAGNAVTIPASALTTGSIACATSTGTTLQTITFTSSGAPVTIWGSALIGGANVQVGIRRNGSNLVALTGQAGDQMFLPAYTDNPGAGTWTYTLHGTSISAGGTAQFRNLFILETKR